MTRRGVALVVLVVVLGALGAWLYFGNWPWNLKPARVVGKSNNGQVVKQMTPEEKERYDQVSKLILGLREDLERKIGKKNANGTSANSKMDELAALVLARASYHPDLSKQLADTILRIFRDNPQNGDALMRALVLRLTEQGNEQHLNHLALYIAGPMLNIIANDPELMKVFCEMSNKCKPAPAPKKKMAPPPRRHPAPRTPAPAAAPRPAPQPTPVPYVAPTPIPRQPITVTPLGTPPPPACALPDRTVPTGRAKIFAGD